MPFLPSNQFNQNDEELKKKNLLSGESSNFNQNTPPGSNQSSLKPQKSSGSYTNIQQYLNANKDNAAQMGNTIAEGVSNKAETAIGDTTKLAGEKQSVAAVDPYSYLNNPDANKATEYQELKATGGYKGPSDISGTANYNTAFKSTNDAFTDVKNTTTEDGRKTLLENKYKRPDYSLGMKNLDNVLVQNDPTSKQKLNDTYNKYSNIMSMFDNTTKDVSDSIEQSKNTAQANKAKFIPAEEAAYNNLMNPIKTRVGQTNIDNTNAINQLLDSDLTDAELASLGLTRGTSTFGLDYKNYVTPDYTESGINNVANADERAKYKNLMALLGKNENQLTDDGKAVNPFSFDKTKFDSDISAKNTEYNAYLNEGSIGGFQDYLNNLGASGSFSGYEGVSAGDIINILAEYDSAIANGTRKPVSDGYAKHMRNYINNINSQFNSNSKL